jgi:hypothetical protein
MGMVYELMRYVLHYDWEYMYLYYPGHIYNANFGWVYAKRIAPSDGHYTQVALKLTRDVYWYGASVGQAGDTLIFCEPGDTPDWAGGGLIELAPPCSNWSAEYFKVGYVTRSQTAYIRGAIAGDRDKAASIIVAAAKLGELPDGITASVQGSPELPITLNAAIQGNTEKPLGIRSAIRAEVELAPGIVAAAAKTDELADGLTASVQGNPQLNEWIRTAIKGETQKVVSIATYIVVTRKDKIRLEMENLGPQEFAHRYVPNWASKTKDYRTDSLGS